MSILILKKLLPGSDLKEMSLAPKLLASKAKVLFLNHKGKLPGSLDSQNDSSPSTRLVAWPLLRSHEWHNREATAIRAVYVNLDEIAATRPLDEWAIKAWRSTFNEFVAKCIDREAQAPHLVGYTTQAHWEIAVLGVQIGVRDIVKMSRIKDHLVRFTGAELKDPDDASNVLPFKKSAPAPSNEAQRVKIPHHAIPFPIEGLEGSSSGIQAVRNLIRKSAPLDTSILITGSTGTGKELVARAVHKHSHRSEKPFVVVNCGAIARELFESELFGHVKGAFTGAERERKGFFESANGGTLFLDEVSSLPLDFQVKLLRVLQEKKITPVGSNESVEVDVRILTATQSDLNHLVEQKTFREDLLYRLRVIEIQIPSLRERKADIPDLCQNILKKFSRRNKRSVPTLSSEALEKILMHGWPGNIRELENVLEHGATLATSENRSEIALKDLPDTLTVEEKHFAREATLKEAVQRFEREHILRTVRRLGGSKEHAAEVLGLSLATLYRKIGKQ